MQTKKIIGNWDLGYALDKHIVRSIPIGTNEFGHMQFDTTRTDIGEALFQLKYRNDNSKVAELAAAIVTNLVPHFSSIGFIVPIPATKNRPIQPVYEIAKEVARLIKKPCFTDMLTKDPLEKSLKNLQTKEEKSEALDGKMHLHKTISNDGHWNVLVIDDLFHTGASMEAACTALREYSKIKKIYAAALTWK